MSNKLSAEKSPYLLQHKDNPVEWYPWNEEAFERAKKENKPIFLSIGYSTCHWCHVMAHESFEDKEVAVLLNKKFVSIKVDREERPDIDHTYMTVCQALTGSGGWPLTIIMTPEKKPFFAATYIPKRAQQGMPGMIELLPHIAHLWENQHEKIIESAAGITKELQKVSRTDPGEPPTEIILDEAFEQLSENFDPRNGGFGDAPKFPSPSSLIFLLRYWKRTKKHQALEIVEKTLQSMRLGGIYDHVGFGFHRYTIDAGWIVPHFEKMLYDQALLAQLYLEAFRATKKEIYAQTTKEILSYVETSLLSPEGALYAGEDADSEGEEGKFYLWTEQELKDNFSTDEFDQLKGVMNIQEEGNFAEESTGSQTGKNILYISSLAKNFPKEIREKLFAIRDRRIHPHRDNKILADWNGLMISAFAQAFHVFGEEKYKIIAEKGIAFFLQTMKKDNHLFHRFCQGERAIIGMLDDYAFMINALLDLGEATGDSTYVLSALEFTATVQEEFSDPQGGFFFSSSHGEELFLKNKQIYDGAIPSGNSVMIENLLRLWMITENQIYKESAIQATSSLSRIIDRSPANFTAHLSAIDRGIGPHTEIVVAGDTNDYREIIKIINETYDTQLIVFLNSIELQNVNPFLRERTKKNGKQTIYVCKNFSCKEPITDLMTLRQLLHT